MHWNFSLFWILLLQSFKFRGKFFGQVSCDCSEHILFYWCATGAIVLQRKYACFFNIRWIGLSIMLHSLMFSLLLFCSCFTLINFNRSILNLYWLTSEGVHNIIGHLFWASNLVFCEASEKFASKAIIFEYLKPTASNFTLILNK